MKGAMLINGIAAFCVAGLLAASANGAPSNSRGAENGNGYGIQKASEKVHHPNHGVAMGFQFFAPEEPPAGEVDTDGDGLSDLAEVEQYGTDPTRADTDGDRLSDGDEVLVWGCDPTLADTDGDFAFDGEEIDFGTDPTNPDTDGGGVDDGTEIHFQMTNPLDPSDDGAPSWMMF